MRRLYLQVYAAFLGIVAIFGVLVAVAWLLAPPDAERERFLAGSAEILADTLPGPDGSRREMHAAVASLGERLGLDLALRGPDGALLAAHGDDLPVPEDGRMRSGWMPGRGKGPVLALRLPDGRWLIARGPHRRGAGWLVALALLALAIAIGAFPVARRITRRLERLQSRVEQLGAGDLTARVEVEGNDEVAELARSFNRAAARIERLVDAQRTMLAGASHELRTPLTRIRMALELLAGDGRAELRERVARDIRELDELIDELLLASRLNAFETLERIEEVDLLALAAEEGARVDASVTGTPTRVQGDARMLRRMLRNLFENARRHGQGTPVEATVAPGDDGVACVVVCDAGPGVPPEERERIFAPFYRAGSAGEGVGLGLALVRRIARRHGGDARCIDADGTGSRFEVTVAAETPSQPHHT